MREDDEDYTDSVANEEDPVQTEKEDILSFVQKTKKKPFKEQAVAIFKYIFDCTDLMNLFFIDDNKYYFDEIIIAQSGDPKPDVRYSLPYDLKNTVFFQTSKINFYLSKSKKIIIFKDDEYELTKKVFNQKGKNIPCYSCVLYDRGVKYTITMIRKNFLIDGYLRTNKTIKLDELRKYTIFSKTPCNEIEEGSHLIFQVQNHYNCREIANKIAYKVDHFNDLLPKNESWWFIGVTRDNSLRSPPNGAFDILENKNCNVLILSINEEFLGFGNPSKNKLSSTRPIITVPQISPLHTIRLENFENTKEISPSEIQDKVSLQLNDIISHIKKLKNMCISLSPLSVNGNNSTILNRATYRAHRNSILSQIGISNVERNEANGGFNLFLQEEEEEKEQDKSQEKDNTFLNIKRDYEQTKE